MKNITASFRFIASLFIVLIFFPGCLKDKMTHTYKIYSPVYKTSSEVRANIKSNVSQNITRPGKIFIRDKYIFLNEIDKGIHVIDNSNPSSPKNLAFIDIPGNMELAVKGNILYADLYTDLVAIDITDPSNVVLKGVTENAFPERSYSNGFVATKGKIIADWISRDTTVQEVLDLNRLYCANCQVFNSPLYNSIGNGSMASSPFGIGGSTARFTIVKNSLYTVNETNLKVYSIVNPNNATSVGSIALGWGIETIYPFKDKLFIGSNSGMFIYDIANESNPVKLGTFSHLKSCDPVIADDTHAYVTLRSGVSCSTGSNQLDVLDISTLTAPTLVKSYPLTNPRGLSKDGNSLLICDGPEGLKVYDATDSQNLKLTYQVKGFESNEVIAYNNLAIVVAKDGLRQYDYSNIHDLRLLSTIGWAQ